MPHTLRSFLEAIDNRILHIHDEIDPINQIGYLCSESQHPLMFDNLTGFPDFRLTDILIKDRHGQAAALGLEDPKEVCPFLAKQMAAGSGKSKMVTDGPVKEVKLIGDEADLRKLPIPIPKTTAIPVVSTSADEAPAKVAHGEKSVASRPVVICVLSPISARKTVKKRVQKSRRSPRPRSSVSSGSSR